MLLSPGERAALDATLDELMQLLIIGGNAQARLRGLLDPEPTPAGIPGRIEILDAATQLPPTGVSLDPGETKNLDAVIYDALVTDHILTGFTVTWDSDTPAAATVDATGLVAHVGAGTARISASVAGLGGTVLSDVELVTTTGPAAVAALVPSVSSVSGSAGAAWSFTAQPKDAAGNNLLGRVVGAVSDDNGVSGAPAVAGYLVSGTLAGVGSAQITVDCEGQTALVSVTVVPAGAFNEPGGLAVIITSDWSGPTEDLSLVQGLAYEGWQAGQSASKLQVRRLSNQPWREAAVTAFPAAPSGDDHVLSCRFMPTEGNGYKGVLRKSLTGEGYAVKTLYLRCVALVSSSWLGHPSAQFKYFDVFFNGGTANNTLILALRGAGAAEIKWAASLQRTNMDGNYQATGTAFGRNFFRRLECLVVASSGSAVPDGHLTLYQDGLKVRQLTGVAWRAAGGGTEMQLLEQLQYSGGVGSGNAGATAPNYCLTDEVYVSGDDTRAALPA